MISVAEQSQRLFHLMQFNLAKQVNHPPSLHIDTNSVKVFYCSTTTSDEPTTKYRTNKTHTANKYKRANHLTQPTPRTNNLTFSPLLITSLYGNKYLSEGS